MVYIECGSAVKNEDGMLVPCNA